MKRSTRLTLVFLGIGHIVVALLLLPSATFFGLISLPLALPFVWLGILGVWLCRPTPKLQRVLETTHRCMVPFELLLVAYGIFALYAAQKSAEEGGGLLGAFGLVPLVMGLVAGCLSMATLWICRSRTLDDGKRQAE